MSNAYWADRRNKDKQAKEQAAARANASWAYMLFQSIRTTDDKEGQAYRRAVVCEGVSFYY